jgi:hypothetical protein
MLALEKMIISSAWPYVYNCCTLFNDTPTVVIVYAAQVDLVFERDKDSSRCDSNHIHSQSFIAQTFILARSLARI